MKLAIKKFIVFWSIVLSVGSLNSQIFDGGLDGALAVGYEPIQFNYLTAGVDVGLGQVISIGVRFKYVVASNESLLLIDFPFNYELRVDLHASSLLDLKSSDILLGYCHTAKTGGVNTEYRYFLNDFFGIYGRTKYFFNPPRIASPLYPTIDNKLRFEIGILFKAFSGDKYDTSNW